MFMVLVVLSQSMNVPRIVRCEQTEKNETKQKTTQHKSHLCFVLNVTEHQNRGEGSYSASAPSPGLPWRTWRPLERVVAGRLGASLPTPPAIGSILH